VPNDRQLAARIARGDTRAFASLLDDYGPRVQRLVRRYARDEPDAEDLTQEIFVDLYRSIGGFRGASSLGTWVYRVALNHCLKHVERRRPVGVPYDDALRAHADETANPAHFAARSELGDQVHTALDRLTPEHREVVILHELQELTYSECAEVLQIPIGTVKSRLSYAFRRLRDALGGYVLGDGGDVVPGRIASEPAS
jgi:RNA polymerase sigma-70 factor (ECF subfamily)